MKIEERNKQMESEQSQLKQTEDFIYIIGY